MTPEEQLELIAYDEAYDANAYADGAEYTRDVFAGILKTSDRMATAIERAATGIEQPAVFFGAEAEGGGPPPPPDGGAWKSWEDAALYGKWLDLRMNEFSAAMERARASLSLEDYEWKQGTFDPGGGVPPLPGTIDPLPQLTWELVPKTDRAIAYHQLLDLWVGTKDKAGLETRWKTYWKGTKDSKWSLEWGAWDAIEGYHGELLELRNALADLKLTKVPEIAQKPPSSRKELDDWFKRISDTFSAATWLVVGVGGILLLRELRKK